MQLKLAGGTALRMECVVAQLVGVIILFSWNPMPRDALEPLFQLHRGGVVSREIGTANFVAAKDLFNHQLTVSLYTQIGNP